MFASHAKERGSTPRQGTHSFVFDLVGLSSPHRPSSFMLSFLLFLLLGWVPARTRFVSSFAFSAPLASSSYRYRKLPETPLRVGLLFELFVSSSPLSPAPSGIFWLSRAVSKVKERSMLCRCKQRRAKRREEVCSLLLSSFSKVQYTPPASSEDSYEGAYCRHDKLPSCSGRRFGEPHLQMMMKTGWIRA